MIVDAESLDDLLLEEYDITHYVSCIATDEVFDFPKTLKGLQLVCPDGNILPLLYQTFAFIEEGRSKSNGHVMVYSGSNTSIAASIVIAYVSQKFKIDLKESFEVLKESKILIKGSPVRPTPQLAAQLKEHYAALNTPAPSSDTSQPISTPTTQSQEPTSHASDTTDTPPSTVVSSATDSETSTDGHGDDQSSNGTTSEAIKPTKIYCCRTCRNFLFSEKDILPHEPSQKFQWRGERKTNRGASCSSYFLTGDMTWMGDTSEIEGKLLCPKCQGKVGSWVWNGSQCSCGAWNTPSFQVLVSRVDPKTINST
eukprot:TRINITY_DN7251_c0_g1_i1.p1 TRINITY_DN7251_c0_g1~~TRINITY_DN7251_c0_g1_i1.p1  ORF type:complete len:337 (+),score=75.29 TRINITY_DN7251_c0_g1_i1:80-1012(+)